MLVTSVEYWFSQPLTIITVTVKQIDDGYNL